MKKAFRLLKASFVLMFMFSFLFFSCSSKIVNKNIVPKTSQMFWEQYLMLANNFKKQNKKIIILPRKYQAYFKSLLKPFFKQKYVKKILLYKSTNPFFCSLPTGEILLSTKLMKNYIIEENKLISVLLFEVLKLKYHIFNKVNYIFTENFGIKDLIRINQVNLANTVKINKLIYKKLISLGDDPSNYLRWIQVKNKNVFHFSLMYPNINIPFKEEYFYKMELVSNKVKKKVAFDNVKLTNSSKKFYQFVNWMKKI